MSAKMAGAPRSVLPLHAVGLAGVVAPFAAWALTTGPLTTAPTSSDLEKSGAGASEGSAGNTEDLLTGAAIYSIPLAVPPGRLGLVPKIDLLYNSHSTDEGPLGLGWTLPLAAIERSLKGGIKYASCETECDVAIVQGSGSSRLVRTQELEYRPKVDDGSRVLYQYDPGSASWAGYDKVGRKYLYGQTAASRQDDPNDPARVFKWCLDRVEDSNGNYLTISYTKDRGQIYPAEILYTGNAKAGVALEPKNAIRFTLVERPRFVSSDLFVRSDGPDFDVTTAFQLTEIQAYVFGALAWKFVIEYEWSATSRLLLNKVRRFGEGGAQELPSIDLTWTSGGSGYYLSSYETAHWDEGGSGEVIVSGDFNGDGRTDLADTSPGSWSWTVRLGSASKFDTEIWPTRNQPAYPPNDSILDYTLQGRAKIVTGDFNGDGRTEIAYAKPGWFLWGMETWNGTGFDLNPWWTTFPGCTEDTCRAVGYGDGHDFVVAGDFNGDGKTDIAHARDKWGGWIVSISTGSSFRTQLWPVGPGNWAIDEIADGKETVLVGDFNGDGKTDIAHTRVQWPYWKVHLSNGQDGFDTQEWSGLKGPDGWNDNSEYFVAGDFDGDGKTDIARHLVWRYPGRPQLGFTDPYLYAGFDYYRSNGKDFVKKGYRNCREKCILADPARYDMLTGKCVRVADPSQATTCYDACVNPEAPCKCSAPLPVPTVFTGDFDGDGKTDLALKLGGDWACPPLPYSSCSGAPQTAGDFTGSGRTDIACGGDVTHDTGQPPERLSSVTNGRGGSTEFTYAPSSQSVNRCLPFVVQVVSEVKLKDGLGNEAHTTYAYEGGYYDLAEKEFRGFRSVTRTNPDGTSLQTWFHQTDGDANETQSWQAENVDYKGKPRRVQSRDSAGREVSTSDYTWQGSSFPTRWEHTYPVVVLLSSLSRKATIGGVEASEQTSYVYDSAGNLTSVVASGTDAETITSTYVPVDWGAAPRSIWKPQKVTVTGSTSGKIRESTFNYFTGTGNLEWSEAWLDGGVNPRTSYTYYPEGNLETVTDPMSRVTRIDYDPTRTFAEVITYPKTRNGTQDVTHQVSFSHDYVHGQVDDAWEENGNKTHVDFDDFGRTIGITHYLGDGPTIAAKTKIDYHDGLPSYIKTSQLEAVDGTSETYLLVAYEYFDGLGRSIETVAPAATWLQDQATTITRTSYDAMGRPWVMRGPFLGSGTDYGQAAPDQYPWVQYEYNGAGRLETARRSDGSVGEALTTLSYEGLKVTVTDPDNKKVSWKKDYLGRVIEVAEYADAGAIYTTKYTHDAAGQLKRIDDQYLNYWTFDYDTLGRKKAIRDPDAGSWSYHYYSDGALWWQSDANGIRLDLTYDDLGRVLSRSHSKPSDGTAKGTVTYTYDTAPNGKGMLASVSNEISSNEKVVDTVLLYDALGRPRSTSRTIAGNASTFTTGTEFDIAGRLSGLTYPDGYKVSYDYYPGTDVLQAVRGLGTTVFATFLAYDASGQPGIISFGNGANSYYTRDPLSLKLTGVVTEVPAPGGTGTLDLWNMAVASSGAGDVTKLSDYVKGGALALPGGMFEYSHRHDALHRLDQEAMTQPLGTPVPNIAYQRHATLAHALGSATTGGTTYSFGYDANGNTTLGSDLGDALAVGARTIEKYSGDNMPERLVYSRAGLTQTADYVYDGAGMRARKTVGLNTTFYVGKHYELVNGEAVKYVFAGDLRIAMMKGADTYYFHKDHLRSTVAVTGQAAGNDPIWTGSYRLFGALREESGTRVTNYLYTDQEYDPESGLYYFGARYYDPVVGRFLTPDTIVARPYDPQSLNRYAYVRNSPASRVDPDGHDLCISWGPNGPSLDCPGSGGGAPPGYYPGPELPGPNIGPYGGGGVSGGGGGGGGGSLPPGSYTGRVYGPESPPGWAPPVVQYSSPNQSPSGSNSTWEISSSGAPETQLSGNKRGVLGLGVSGHIWLVVGAQGSVSLISDRRDVYLTASLGVKFGFGLGAGVGPEVTWAPQAGSVSELREALPIPTPTVALGVVSLGVNYPPTPQVCGPDGGSGVEGAPIKWGPPSYVVGLPPSRGIDVGIYASYAPLTLWVPLTRNGRLFDPPPNSAFWRR